MDYARHIASLVQRLEPGEGMQIDPEIMHAVRPLYGWTKEEWIMELVVGSAREYRYWIDPSRRTVAFERLLQPLPPSLRTYVSPDRRDKVDRLDNGLYRLRDQTAAV